MVYGELIRIYSVAFLGKRAHGKEITDTSEIITSGPYRFVRNPVYVGNFLIAMGTAVFGGITWLVILTFILFLVQYYFISQLEETTLRDQFGDDYRIYCEKVPGWIPHSFPKLDDLEWPKTFAPAIRMEKSYIFAILLIILALNVI